MRAVCRARSILVAGVLILAAPTIVRADCPQSRLQVGDFFSDLPGPSGTFQSRESYGYGDVWFLDWGDSLGFEILPWFVCRGSAQVRGTFQVLGPSAGSLVALQLEMHVRGDMNTAGSFGCNDRETARLLVNNGVIAERTWFGTGDDTYCSKTFQEVLSASVNVTAGQPFAVEQYVDCYSDGVVNGWLKLGSSFWFGALPPGAFVVACDGDTTAHVLAVGPGASSALALDAVWPNPSRGEIHASCALPRGGPAVLRLFDAAGRVVETRIWDAPAATRREVTLGGPLAPGAYFLQVSQGATWATRPVIIVR